jgi:hypothetical protein
MNTPGERTAGYIGIGGSSETWADKWGMGDDQVRKWAERGQADWPFH